MSHKEWPRPHSIRLMPISPGKLTAERRILYGLLTASFRPADQVVVLRSYLRQRQMLIGYAAFAPTHRVPWFLAKEKAKSA